MVLSRFHVRIVKSIRCFCLLTAAFTTAIHALSGSPPVAFRIVGDSRTGTQYLPTSYALQFVRWEVDHESQLTRLKDQPVLDLSSSDVRIRPTVDFVVKGGVPVYFMAGLQTISSLKNAAPLYPSVIAQQWLTFDMIVEPNMRLLVFNGEGDGTDERLAFYGPDDVNPALQRLGVALSMESERSDQLSKGFHIISIPMNDEWIRVTKGEEHRTITCMATAEPEPRELFSLNDSLLEITVTSVLQINLKTPVANK